MATYFDSSVLLSLLMGDAQAAHAQRLWHADTERVSSTLIDVECTTVLRRAAMTAHANVVLAELLERLSKALEEITLKPLDADIASLVRDEPALCNCRALDAAHLGTALYFRSGDPELFVCTFDARMGDVAKKLEFTLRA